ncbi:CDP-diacylglycerol--glycerol-3-phosphate 3-phosphatidyltransferase [Spirochaeta isovalerica]|uniref:CDP-diacylglycerol--glycerol-3-phosphate 3-phosphatidyltransferase n=1 Tax=Spirochaeta isovalerica TaxID=150 RepID=A0A841RKF9_9SPIO|nr:CDP-diacylglycerol--glycerol-3-phosphate 3-phosphatidyltransferase [Spirochaeta isovalerica]MBB6482752.1 CDP-diacylglycerol--glycerol-3-phosphate 3-phosphatidyltransferase [Spirochaeta isovalerica]
MTLPNKLTLGRLVLTPVYFFIFYFFLLKNIQPVIGISILWIMFIVMEVTDVLDGHIARKYNLVSDVGKLMDPFADVIARVTYFICFFSFGIMPLWALIIIVWREYFIMFIRMLIAKEGTALAASIWGKSKAVTYFVSGILAHIAITLNVIYVDYKFKIFVDLALYVLFVLSALSALFSFLSYLKNYMKTETHKKFMNE